MIKRRLLWILAFFIGVLLLSVTASAHQSVPSASADQFSGDNALERVADLVAFGPRTTGSAEIMQAGDFILNSLSGLGWDASSDWHTLDFGLPVLVPARNLVASIGQGTTVILGAHYDSRIHTDRDPDPAHHNDRALGADDNASGVGVLLELARVISQSYTANQQIRLVFFDAEDNPNISPWAANMGSAAYVNNLDLTHDNIRYAIVVDMVGDDDQLIPMEATSKAAAPEQTQAIWQAAADLGYGVQFGANAANFLVKYSIIDDQTPFIQRGIPAVLMIDLDYPYWHTRQDTLDKVSAPSLERVGRVLLTFLERDGVITPR